MGFTVGRAGVLATLLLYGCSEKPPDAPASFPSIQAASFAIVETELTPAILVHSESRYLGLRGDAPEYIAFATRSGPRSFKRGEKLKPDEMEECWLVLWATNIPPWVVYLQHKPRAISLDTNGLHLSFVNAAGDLSVLPLHGSSANIDTKKWPEFLTREPLLRIRYWASVLREFPVQCDTTILDSYSVRQRFQFHSIRDDWNTRPLKLSPVSPPLAALMDEKHRRELRDLKMATPFGPYMGFENVSEWKADFPATFRLQTNCAWVSIGDCKVLGPNTALIRRIESFGHILPSRDQMPKTQKESLLNPSTRMITYD